MTDNAKNQDTKMFEHIAILIENVNLPISQSSLPMVPGECNEPQCWINNYAEGIAKGCNYTKEEAAHEIRIAFELKYGMSPEEMQNR